MFTRRPVRLFLFSLIFAAGFSNAKANRIPAYIFPDADSTIMTYIEVSPDTLSQFPRVLDISLDEDWHWTTFEDEFIGYVNKRDINQRNKLKPGTLIRVEPTYSSWILTKYEPDDQIRVRSRLSIGRVSLQKEIPVYFKASDVIPAASLQNWQSREIEATSPPVFETKVEETIPEPQPEAEPTFRQNPEPQPVEQAETVLPEPEVEIQPLEQSEGIHPIEPEREEVLVIQEPVQSFPEYKGDPLLEEKPRMSAQELANLAPPPVALLQEFEGFLRLVPAEDDHADRFQYQLETRSGRRIVYVDIRNLAADSIKNNVEQWINIRGTLEETESDYALYIMARNIWISTPTQS